MTVPLRRDEKAFNPWLAAALRSHGKQAEIAAETKGQLMDVLKQPDITVKRRWREPVVIENKYSDVRDGQLDKQCVGRLDQWWAEGPPVTVVVGVTTPIRFSRIPDDELASGIRNANDFEWALWTGIGSRLPAEG